MKRWLTALQGRGGGLQALLGAVGGVLVVLWAGSNGYHQDLVVLFATYAMLALGMYIAFVLTGTLSLAYSAYVAVGAYAVGLVATKSGWPLAWGFVFGAVVAALLAVVLGAVTRRLSGFYLAAVTLLFAQAFQTWLLDADGITGGATPVSVHRQVNLFGYTFGREALIIAGIVVVWLAAVALDRLRRAPFGIALRARREVPAAVDSVGISVPVVTLLGSAIGAALAAIGGSLFVSVNHTVSPDTFTLDVVFLALFMPLLGGQRSAWGAVVGAILIVEFSFNLTWFENTGTLLFSLAVLAVLLVAPRGVLGLFEAGAERLRGEHR